MVNRHTLAVGFRIQITVKVSVESRCYLPPEKPECLQIYSTGEGVYFFQTDKDVHRLVLRFLLFIFKRTSCSSEYFCGRYMETHPGVRRPGPVWGGCGDR